MVPRFISVYPCDKVYTVFVFSLISLDGGLSRTRARAWIRFELCQGSPYLNRIFLAVLGLGLIFWDAGRVIHPRDEVKKVSKYDQEMSEPQTSDQPTAPRARDTEQIRLQRIFY